MTRPPRIGLAGQAAARATARRRTRCGATVAGGRLEVPAPPLAASLLTRRARLAAPGAWAVRIELRLAPVTVLRSEAMAAPAASIVVPAPHGDARLIPVTPGASPDPPAMTLSRETIRERIERTVERLVARGRREEPPRRLDAPAVRLGPDRAATPAMAPPVFTKLVLPVLPVAARAAEAAGSDGGSAPPAVLAPPAVPATGPLPQAAQIPRLVEEIVGELERRTRAQRERRGWLG